LIDALEGLAFDSPAGSVTVGKDHHTTMNMFLAKTKGGAGPGARGSSLAIHSLLGPDAERVA
jgi:hypothetical protein